MNRITVVYKHIGSINNPGIFCPFSSINSKHEKFKPEYLTLVSIQELPKWVSDKTSCFCLRRAPDPRGLAFNCLELLPIGRHCPSRLSTGLYKRRGSTNSNSTIITSVVLWATLLNTAMLPALFHLLVLLHHTYVSYHLLTQIDFSKTDDDYVHNVMKKFKFRYFTSWNFVSSIFFYSSNDASSAAWVEVKLWILGWKTVAALSKV